MVKFGIAATHMSSILSFVEIEQQFAGLNLKADRLKANPT
jgi:hypothetical protein